MVRRVFIYRKNQKTGLHRRNVSNDVQRVNTDMNDNSWTWLQDGAKAHAALLTVCYDVTCQSS